MGVRQAVVWLPVALAASLPLGLMTAWGLARTEGNPPPSERGASQAVAPPESPRLSPAFTPEVRYWAPQIERWSREYSLPVDLIGTVMQIESCGHPGVRSPAGALGLFQVMPFHFGAGEDPLRPETNAARGLSYLARSYALAGGELDRTLAGYNGGHGVIGRPRASWPEETRRYAAWGTQILGDLQSDAAHSPGLAAWLQAGGASLCRQAAAALGVH